MNGITLHQLQRYLILREHCDEDLKTILSLATMLSYLDHCTEPTLKLDPEALAHTQRMIVNCTLNVLEALENFVTLADAKQCEHEALSSLTE